MTLPKVWAPLIWMPRLLRWRRSWAPRRSARQARMHASQTELSRTSSMASSSSPTKARVRSTSEALEFRCTAFSRIEPVTVVGCRPQALISSMSIQTPSLLLLIVASMSSLKVTELGAKLPPAERIVSMTARARSKCPCCRCFLMMVLYVTTSATPAATASAMVRSASSMSWQSMHASSRLLYRDAVFPGHARKTASASARRRSVAKPFSKPTRRGVSVVERRSCSSTSGRLRRRATSATRRPVRASAKRSTPARCFSQARRIALSASLPRRGPSAMERSKAEATSGEGVLGRCSTAASARALLRWATLAPKAARSRSLPTGPRPAASAKTRRASSAAPAARTSAARAASGSSTPCLRESSSSSRRSPALPFEPLGAHSLKAASSTQPFRRPQAARRSRSAGTDSCCADSCKSCCMSCCGADDAVAPMLALSGPANRWTKARAAWRSAEATECRTAKTAMAGVTACAASVSARTSWKSFCKRIAKRFFSMSSARRAVGARPCSRKISRTAATSSTPAFLPRPSSMDARASQTVPAWFARTCAPSSSIMALRDAPWRRSSLADFARTSAPGDAVDWAARLLNGTAAGHSLRLEAFASFDDFGLTR
mmetsp:Transcript_66627/g.177454  ORF Transcript_66627/g.177454 Transcript_66627/m.177454 type:complete len:604 (-) Transcript_66627:216-2027(-)